MATHFNLNELNALINSWATQWATLKDRNCEKEKKLLKTLKLLIEFLKGDADLSDSSQDSSCLKNIALKKCKLLERDFERLMRRSFSIVHLAATDFESD